MDGFAVNYNLANAACIIVFGILVLYNHFSLDRQESQVKFGRALVAFALYFLTDCFWAAVMEDPAPEKRTGLNNRGQLMRYTSQNPNLYLDDRRTIVAMSDIDEFKSINDTHGHAEGDHALVVVADVLKRVVGRHEMPSFLGRFGGDEFILILHPKREEDPDELIRTIRSEIEEEIGTEDVSYPLALSLGYDELEEGEDGIQSCFARADESLYREKTKRKAPR